jgi:hypothetical protein
MTPQMRRTLAAVLALGAVAAFLGYLSFSRQEPPQPVSEIAASTPRALQPRPVRELANYAAISERPLFAASRRPTPPPPPKEIAVAQPPPEPAPPLPREFPAVTLLAVALSPDRREAVLRLPTGGSSTLVEGAEFQGWTLVEVAADRVVFRLGDVEKQVSFPKPVPTRPNASRPPALSPRH